MQETSIAFEALDGEAIYADETQPSTAGSDLNSSIENLKQKRIKIESIEKDEKSKMDRKPSAPSSIPRSISLDLSKCGKGPRGSYFSKLLCKGLLC